MTNQSQFAKRFLRWVRSHLEGDNERAKTFCREKWDKYGHEVLKRATKEKSCTSLERLVTLANKLVKMKERKK